MRHVAAEGSASANRYKALPKFPRSAGQPWANIYNGPQHVIFGHHARRRLQVLLAYVQPIKVSPTTTEVNHAFFQTIENACVDHMEAAMAGEAMLP